MATITNLPVEVIYVILDFNNISVHDFANFSSTCKHFYQMLYPNSFWRRKFDQRWPGLKNIRQTEMHKGYLSVEELIDVRVNCKKELPHLLVQMSEKYYHNGSDEFLKEKLKFHGNRPFQCFLPFRTVFHEGFLNNEIFDMEEFNFLVYPPKTTHHLNYYLVMDELTSLNDRWKRHHYLENVWEEFINRPPKHQLLEEVITFIIQWFHPEKNVSCSHIDMDLDNIAQQVMKLLKVEDPKHPIFSASREQFSSWKYNNIYENQWNNSEGRQIIDILCNILLHKPTFDAVVHSLKSELFRQYLFLIHFEFKIDAEMNIVPLIVIFQSVARRLGIYCDLISFLISDFPASEILMLDPGYEPTPNYWLLTWKPKCDVTNSDDEQCLYIHLEEGRGGTILNKNNLPRIYESTLECPISFDRYPRINLLELMLTLAAHYVVGIYFELDNYRNYHSRNCNESNQEVFEEDRWMDRLLHLVEECLSISQTLYMTGKEDVFKFVDELEKCIFFISEYLEKLNTPTPINSCQLGEYFSEFQGTYYIPNKMLATEYPDDVLYLVNNL
ncbi:uncharacterized protein LOC113561496 [Ooceraea biroi]|uniref:uncharacterized protein LOC113561496 n=1 Tax=Ooceraea biroi TaxID=2015173 RepID=UPI000F087B88|nr:uncharacterized protein LOC113561496 [Ooceraea biroi]